MALVGYNWLNAANVPEWFTLGSLYGNDKMCSVTLVHRTK